MTQDKTHFELEYQLPRRGSGLPFQPTSGNSRAICSGVSILRWSIESTMISTRWLEKRKPYWSKLETLLNQSALGGLKLLSRSDLQELSLLYRQTAADLAAIREYCGSVHFASDDQ